MKPKVYKNIFNEWVAHWWSYEYFDTWQEAMDHANFHAEWKMKS